MAQFIKVRNNHIAYPVTAPDRFDTAFEDWAFDPSFVRIEVNRYAVNQDYIRGEIIVHRPDDSSGSRTHVFRSLELPWLDNRTSISCIPNGLFAASYKKSPSFGCKMLYLSVPERSGIMFHGGRSLVRTRGCILISGYDSVSKDIYATVSPSVVFYKLIDSLASQGYKFYIDVHC